MHRTQRVVFLAVLAAFQALPLAAATIDNQGGVTLVVSFEENSNLSGNIPVPVRTPDAEAHYCQVFTEFSKQLWITTEGTHWIKRVAFFEELGDDKRDVAWNYITNVCGDMGTDKCPADSFGSFGRRVLYRERGYDPMSDPLPYTPSYWSMNYISRLMNHEFGHFFYRLSDEYVNFNSYLGGRTGFCLDTYDGSGSVATGQFCDEEEHICPVNVPCIFKGQCAPDPGEQGPPPGTTCVQDGPSTCDAESDNPGSPCADDDDCPNGKCLAGCGVGGYCLGKNSNRVDKIDGSTKRICIGDTNLTEFGGAGVDEVCLMKGASSSGPGRWCDGGKEDDNQLPDATHVFVWPESGDYQAGTVQFDLGNTPGAPAEEVINGRDFDYLAHSCWVEAAKKHVELEDAHAVGQDYSTSGDLLMILPPTLCEWNIDLVAPGDHLAVLIDRSGSMGYQDLSDPPRPAIDLALAGAQYIYNQVDDGDWVAAYLFNAGTAEATSQAAPLSWSPKVADIDVIDSIPAVGGTDIAEAIRTSVDDMLLSAAPDAHRNIVLFSDGKDNGGGDPYFEAERACGNGIAVHTIAYGNADSAALDELAECGPFWVTGTGQANDPGNAEPDPLDIKSALARMGHRARGRTEVLELSGPLRTSAGSTLEERQFVVPPGTRGLTFAWLGNATCVATSIGGGPCEPVLNLLISVELESPSGAHHPAGLPPDAASGVYRTVELSDPEAGIWTARLDLTEPVPAPSPIPGEWELKVEHTAATWTAQIDHRGIEASAWVEQRRGPLDAAVEIRAELQFGTSLSNLDVQASVTHAGQSWVLTMADDGQSGDVGPSDGVYGAIFNPDGTWAVGPGAYRVKVRMESEAGKAVALASGETNEDDGEPFTIEQLPAPPDVVAEAETSFRLSSRYAINPDGTANPGSALVSCPNLVRGGSYTGLFASVDGIRIDPATTRLSLGAGVDMTLDSATCDACTSTATDPGGSILFSATVDADAPTGPRTFSVQEQFDIVRAPAACRVCSAPGVELCNGIDDDCNGLVDEDAAGAVDPDLDGVASACDNCAFVANPSQDDFDADGEGDACDVDDGAIRLRLSGAGDVSWDPEGGGLLWNVYRGDLSVLLPGGTYTQLPGANPLADRLCGLPFTSVSDGVALGAGEAAFYLVTDATGPVEGDLGQDSSGATRPNDNPCPGGPV